MRKNVIDMVLATDMAEHQRIVNLLRQDLFSKLHGKDPGAVDDKALTLMICGAIKISDLGHSFADFEVHRRWSKLLEEELFRQGDEERRRNLSISYLMDRSKPGVTRSQKGFFDYVVRPLALAWVDCLPASRPLIDQMESNAARWRTLVSHCFSNALGMFSLFCL